MKILPTRTAGHGGPRPAGIGASAPYSADLESLRGWAILLVFFYHADSAVYGLDRIGTVVSPLLAFITAGHTGVTLFFVLSAYLLSRPFLIEGAGGRRVRRLGFYRRRILRIMPLYAAVVIGSILLCLDEPHAVRDGLRALLFVNSISGVGKSLLPYSAVWWSLATEIQFYLVLPALALALASRTGRVLGLGALLAWAVAYAVVERDHGLMSLQARMQLGLSLLGRLPAFLAGIGAAWLVARFGEPIRRFAEGSRVIRNGGADGLLLAVLVALGLLLQEVSHRGFFPAEIAWPIWHIPESVLWGLVLLLVVLAPLRSRPLLSNRVMATVGLLSYSLYLLHTPILTFGHAWAVEWGFELREDLVTRGVAFGIALVVSLGLSALTYAGIERPFLLRKTRVET